MSKKGMHPEDIKAAIKKKGVTLQDLSLGWGFSHAAINVCLSNPMPRLEPLIAAYIGKQLHDIWPDRYDKNNIRIYPKRPSRLVDKNRSRVTQKNNEVENAKA